jgi:hypothetical protein
VDNVASNVKTEAICQSHVGSAQIVKPCSLRVGHQFDSRMLCPRVCSRRESGFYTPACLLASQVWSYHDLHLAVAFSRGVHCIHQLFSWMCHVIAFHVSLDSRLAVCSNLRTTRHRRYVNSTACCAAPVSPKTWHGPDGQR